jgi:hypothetical protein
MKTSQSCVVGVLRVGSTMRVSFQFSSVSSCCTAEATLAATASSGAGAAGTADVTASLALFKNPLTFSKSGIWSSARASAGSASRRVDVKRMVAVWCRRE